jgi:hypothetical protein
MNFWGGLALLAVLHLIVNAGLLPQVENRWLAQTAREKVARAATIAGLQTAGDFLRIAALSFAGVAAGFLALQWLAPAATLGVLSDVQGAALVTRDWAKAASSTLGQILFWLGIAGAFAILWALTLASFRETLAVEYLRQLRALAVKSRRGELEPLPDSEEMRVLRAQIANPGDLGPDNDRRRLAHRLRYGDLVRRIDLGKQTLPLGANRAHARLMRLLFSEGLVDLGKNSTKRLGKIATATTCILLLGTAAPPLRSGLVEPAIDTLAGLRIARELAASGPALDRIAAAPSRPSAPDDPDYRLAAEQFLDALADDSAWLRASARLTDRTLLPTGDTRALDNAFDSMVARDAVVRSYAADPAGGTRAFALEDVPVNDPGRAVLEEMRRREWEPGALRAAAAQRLEQALRKAAATVPGFREKLKASLAGFNRPARLGTFAAIALGDQFALAVGAAIPGPGSEAVFEAEGARAGRKGLQKGFEQIVQIRFAGFLNDIAAGRPLGTALRRVQGDGFEKLLRRGDAAALAGLLDQADRRRNAFLGRILTRRPVIAAMPDAGEVRAVNAVLAAPNWQAAVPLVAQFDDVLPGTTMTLPTALGLAAAGKGLPRAPELARTGVLGKAALGRAPRVKARGVSIVGLALTAAEVAAAMDAPVADVDTSQIRGVSVSGAPGEGEYRVRNLAWQLSPTGIRLRAEESGGRLIPDRAIDPAVVRAALAVAADDRPMVMIAVPTRLQGVNRWLLHPVVENTAIGGTIVDLYRQAVESDERAALLGFRLSFDGMAAVGNAGALGIDRNTHDFLALVPVFRAAFAGRRGVEGSTLVKLASELAPYRLARTPTPRMGFVVPGFDALRR